MPASAGSGAAAAKSIRSKTRKKSGGGKHHGKSAATRNSAKPMTLLEQAEYQIHLSKAQSKEMAMRKLFHDLDADSSGFIDRTELRPLLVRMGFKDEDANGGFDRFLLAEFHRSDSSGDGKIDFEEFAALHNRLVDQSNNISHLNHAISLIDGLHGGGGGVATSNDDHAAYLERIELLAAADRGMAGISQDMVATLDMMGAAPPMEVLQVFTCLLILFGLPEGDSPEDDWKTAQSLFDGPTFIDDLRTFDHTKLRRDVVMRALQRAETLVNSMSSLETRAPVAHALLCWVLVLIARAKQGGVMDAPTLDNVPVQRRSSFMFSLGTNERRGVWRILDSDMFEGNFHKKRDAGGTPGVSLQLGQLASNFKQAVASVIFDRRKFTEEQAGMWWVKHKGDPQFATAVAAAAEAGTPRVAYDFSRGGEMGAGGSGPSQGRGYRHVPEGMVEHWGYDEDGVFKRTLVKAEHSFGLAQVQLVDEDAGIGKKAAVAAADGPSLNSVGLPISSLMERAVNAVASLTKEQMTTGMAELAAEPKYAETTIRVVLALLGEDITGVVGWDAARAAVPTVERMRTFDIRLVSRLDMRKRIKTVEPFFLDPGYTPQGLHAGNPAVYAMLRWSKAVISSADDEEAVKAGRSIDNNSQ